MRLLPAKPGFSQPWASMPVTGPRPCYAPAASSPPAPADPLDARAVGQPHGSRARVGADGGAYR
jgi:hypothetical protein